MKIYPGLFLLLFIASCTVEYDMKPTNITEPDRIVVNSYLNPLKPVRVYFYTTQKTDSGYIFLTASGLHVRLTEDGTTLFEGICSDTVLLLNHHPKAHSTYRIEASLENYESISAETTIPDTISCRARAEERGYNSMIFYLSDFKGRYQEDRSSLYIASYSIEESDTLYQSADLYANNYFIDNINRQDGMDVEDEEVGSSYYENFIRIKNRNIPLIDSLVFLAFMRGGYYTLRYGQVNIITASPEYDQYYRTFYEQMAKIVYEDDLSTIAYQPIQVYSNIHNGLGIFAGMNESNYYFEISDKGVDPFPFENEKKTAL